MRSKTFAEKVQGFEFHPEVYVYPTPRAYNPLGEFALEDVEFTQEVNLYIHIPFCKQICSYCGYLKIIDSKGKLKEGYLDALTKEILMYKGVLENKIVRTLHFGGGTPSLLSVSELENIINSLLDINPNLLDSVKEVSIEATPESVEERKFSEYKQLGINRTSIGIQSLNNNEIAMCKRKNSLDISLRAIKILRNTGFQNIVADLMIGIEGQTVKSFEDSVKRLLELRPETVELYALGLMPHTRLGVMRPHLMNSKNIYRCYDIGRSLFLEAGYKQDCHNRYAIPNRGSFLQEDFVFGGMSLIGLGAGARTYAENVHYRNSLLSDPHKKSVIGYIKNINHGKLAIKEGIFLDSEEKIRQYIIYNIESLDKADFNKRFGVHFEEQFKTLYEGLLRLRLAKDNGVLLELTPNGLNFRDLIAKELFSEKVKQAEENYRPK